MLLVLNQEQTVQLTAQLYQNQENFLNLEQLRMLQNQPQMYKMHLYFQTVLTTH